MSETPATATDALSAATVSGHETDPPPKTWDEYEACQQCRGRAHIDELPDGNLVCSICRCELPRPSS